ncbi:MAG: PAS domain S-box protein [Chloroflexi bacterium]|nr:PAS domain S-box protein [Chloroflexota bacterium]
MGAMREMRLPNIEPGPPLTALTDSGAGLARLFGALSRSIPSAEAAVEPYRTFLEALAVAVYTTDADGRITFFNQAAVDLWGRRPELGEEWCGSFRLFHHDGRPMAHGECPMAISLKENRPVRGTSAIAERPDGRRVAFEPYPTPLRSADGALVGAVNVLVDVTERLAAEEALLASTEALKASNAVKDEFLGLISHELRTPVTSIYGNAVLLAGRLDAVEPEAGMIRDLGEDAERLLRIVENLLQLTRLTSGSTFDCEPQVLDHAVRASIASRNRRYPDREIRLTIADSSIVVDADDVALDMIIDNLLSNANKYSPAGRPIDVVLSSDDREGTVRILDRGIGIPDEIVSDVFTPFFREDRARRIAGGVGVGLAVCKRIVENLGGRIWAAPREGGGAEVGFALPLSRDLDEGAQD